MNCKCGCGGNFTPSRTTQWRLSKGEDVGYLPGHAHRGARNPRWRGGRFVSADGYVYLLRPWHPNCLTKGYVGYIAEHRLVMSEHLERPLLESELVHHINGIRSDNSVSNLVVMSRPAHMTEHHTGANNVNWNGGLRPKACARCGKQFIAKSIRTQKRAKYCSRKCFNDRNR